ncbi:MAG: tRNA pseudouridine(38-40) synthase TruA [Gammaproteobacteria bacterium]|jgi:tRNA pseudouridine38-40 synthase
MRLAFGVEYDGTEFFGWQRQASGRTVQGSLEAALARVADHEVHVVCAGRTDTGVHATGQVIHVDSDAVRTPSGWLRGTNANLPGDIRVQWVAEIDGSFHARFRALRRHYRYVVLNRPTGSALLRNRTCREYRPLDTALMTSAATALTGEHDFTSFRAAACQAKSPVRTVHRVEICRRGHFIYIDVEANAFLHHMVRCIAGVLMAIGRGEQPPGWVADVLAARDRTISGVNAPPGGLYLVAVTYPAHYSLPTGGWLPVFS